MTRYLGALLLSAACSWLLTPEMRKIALARGIVDRPRGRHIHAQPVPFLGGVAMYAAFFVAAVAFGRPDRNTVGLLTGGASGTPEAQLRAPSQGFGNHPLRQECEVLGLAEEAGLVGRKSIDHVENLGVAARASQVVEVLVNVGEVQGTKASSQSSLDQSLLALVQVDAANLVSEAADRIKLLASQFLE